MKTKMLVAFVAVLLFGISTGKANAASKKTTVQGLLGTTANGSSSFITASDKEYYFDPTSKVGKKIWDICERDQVCIVTGVIKKDNIVSVSKVEKANSLVSYVIWRNIK